MSVLGWGRGARPERHDGQQQLDEQRMQELVQANASALLAYLQRRTQPLEDAADLLSEVLLTAWRRVRDLPGGDEAGRMWLFVTACNVLANHRRAQVRHEAMAQRLREHISDEHRLRPHAAVSSADEVFEQVHQAVRELPELQRELVILVHWDGFTIVEAAALTGVSPSTARSRYAAARAGLAQRLRMPSTEDGDVQGRPPTRLLTAVPFRGDSGEGIRPTP